MNTVSRLLVIAALVSLAACAGNKKDKTPVRGDRLPVLAFEQKLEEDPSIADLKVTLPAPFLNPDWPQSGGSPAKAMHHLSLPTELKRAWTTRVGQGNSSYAALVASPVMADGKVFAIDTQARVFALNADSGREVWNHKLGFKGEKKRTAFGGGVGYGEGKLFATTGYGFVAALDPATGQELWRKELGLPLRGAPTISEGRVYVITQDNQLFALSTQDGKELWDSAGISEVAQLLGAGSPAVASDTLVVGFSSGELNALRVENGRTTWQDSLARTGRLNALASLVDIDGSPVIDRGNVYAIGHGGRMVSLELSTGERTWEANLGGTGTPWVAGDFVYVITTDGELICLTRREGKVRWLTQLQRYQKITSKKGIVRWSGPVLASDRLVLVSSNGYLATVSPYTGDLLSLVKMGDGTYLAPIVANNTLYVMTSDGDLSAYR